jgi:hypothetical protein
MASLCVRSHVGAVVALLVGQRIGFNSKLAKGITEAAQQELPRCLNASSVDIAGLVSRDFFRGPKGCHEI